MKNWIDCWIQINQQKWSKKSGKNWIKGINIIGIVVNSGSADKISKFVEKFKITYPILKGSDKVYKDFGYIRVLPTTFILNQKGEIYKKYIGYIDKKYLEHEIKKLLDYKK